MGAFPYNRRVVQEDDMPGRLGPMEIFLILLIVVLIFGGKKIPEIGKGIGEGIKNFKDAMKKGEEGQSDKK
jgi:sec-independent protein translocase protein TatA